MRRIRAAFRETHGRSPTAMESVLLTELDIVKDQILECRRAVKRDGGPTLTFPNGAIGMHPARKFEKELRTQLRLGLSSLGMKDPDDVGVGPAIETPAEESADPMVRYIHERKHA